MKPLQFLIFPFWQIQKTTPNTITVLDRKTGKPIENVTLKSPYFDIKTNADGLAIYKNKEEQHQI